ncbi:Zinc/iron permease [Mrakia frigida]|uniref:Mn(2+) transporter ATX2 n=1 Tax=Mrakia frigida TaxID=29902 RepID=UPI003FCBFF2E
MGLASLLFQSLAMGFSSFFMGLVPLMFSSVASGKRLKMASTFGMGLLVGAAMVVIIPEGISTIYSSTVVHPTTSHNSTLPAHASTITPSHVLATLKVVRDSSSSSLPLTTPVAPRDDDHDDDDEEEDDEDEHDHDHGKTYGSDPTEAIGLSLLSGFVLMMLIEQFSHSHSDDSPLYAPLPTNEPSTPSSPSHLNAPSSSTNTTSNPPPLSPSLPSSSSPNPPTWHSLVRRPSEGQGPGMGSDDGISLRPEDERGEDALPRELSGEGARLIGRAVDKVSLGDAKLVNGGNGGDQHEKSFSATLGLVLHSTADGIALGASARSGKSGLGLVIFLAIFVHKIPASLGLCTTLMSDSLPRHQIRQRIALFSAAAPVGAILTYFLVNLLAGGIEQSVLMWWTGVALMFSGGTFLYVIATVLQDLNPSKTELEEPNAISKRLRMVLVLSGMLAPLVLTRLGGHHH